MHILTAMLLALAAPATPAPANGPVPQAAWPDSVRVATRAIAARDAAAIAARFRVVGELAADRSPLRYLSADEALAALAGCRPTGVTRGHDEYDVHFSCPGHPRRGCDSGDIEVRLVRMDWLETFTVRHERIASAACAIRVAPPLPPPVLLPRP